jgi:SprT protein
MPCKELSSVCKLAKADMRLLRQLEFSFDQFVTRVSARRNAAVGRDHTLETKARKLLRTIGAMGLARGLRVEWNSRMQTVAGRADYRSRLISLNPELVHYPAEIDRTLRHELAHILARFRAGRRRTLPHGVEWQQACRDLGISGEKRCHNLPFPAKRLARRYLYRCPNCQRDFPRVRPIKRAVACLACCRKHNGGDFDARFRLKLVRL